MHKSQKKPFTGSLLQHLKPLTAVCLACVQALVFGSCPTAPGPCTVGSCLGKKWSRCLSMHIIQNQTWKRAQKSTIVWKRTHILLKLKEKLPSLPFFRDNVSLHSSQESPSSQSVSNSCGKRQLGVLLLPRDGMPVIAGYLHEKVKLHFSHHIVLLTFLAPKEGRLSIPVWQGGRQLNNQPPLLHKSPLELL